ncbi:hypothetical protein CK203_039508 [Vitis vinifera]|uniref:Uncharacterized protein n=1 Tax=Vitis vinifera TaxID=29760 RepID=A0A438HKP1_VITVI|nr:hypothetical protein CK203_039508 [Vitis vinifera]
MENVDCTIELSIDIPPILSQKRVDLDDVLETSEDDEEPVMKTDSNVVYDMVMSERYVYKALKTMMLIEWKIWEISLHTFIMKMSSLP